MRGATRVAWFAVLIVLVVGGCAGKQGRSRREPAPQPLRVGVTGTYPPISFVEDGEAKGVEPDLARKIAQRLGRPIDIQVFKLEDLIPALNTQRIDVIMAGMSITPERERQVHFTQPYLRVGQMTLIRKSDEKYVTDYARMNRSGAKVGVKRGTTGEQYARANLTGAAIVTFETIGEGKTALRTGKIDYFIHDAPTVWRTTGRFENDPDLTGMYRPLTEEYLAWAVRPADERTLGRELDQILDQLEASGELNAVLDRWLPVRRVTVD
jgi:ABC-type amino acid transport substrate-binding protein